VLKLFFEYRWFVLGLSADATNGTDQLPTVDPTKEFEERNYLISHQRHAHTVL
jgi:hypothetical protein